MDPENLRAYVITIASEDRIVVAEHAPDAIGIACREVEGDGGEVEVDDVGGCELLSFGPVLLPPELIEKAKRPEKGVGSMAEPFKGWLAFPERHVEALLQEIRWLSTEACRPDAIDELRMKALDVKKRCEEMLEQVGASL